MKIEDRLARIEAKLFGKPYWLKVTHEERDPGKPYNFIRIRLDIAVVDTETGETLLSGTQSGEYPRHGPGRPNPEKFAIEVEKAFLNGERDK